MGVAVAKLTITTLYWQALRQRRAFNAAAGRIKKNESWPEFPGLPSLKWVPGKTFWENKGDRRHVDHITRRVPVGL